MITLFLSDLFDHGNVQVGHPDQAIDDAEWSQARKLLQEYDLIRQAEFPGEPPPFAVEPAVWACRTMYRACQAIVYRDLPSESLAAFFGDDRPSLDDPSVHYSVDLVFRFLPDVIKLASHVAAGDPLVEILQQWANQFPLSSVGIKQATPISVDALVNHPALRRYYVDRVIARRDKSRLLNSLVREEVQRAIGMYGKLFAEFDAWAK